MNAAVNTKAIAGRRSLSFASIAAVRTDLNALEAAQRQGRLKAIGNWTEGEIFTHLAAFLNYPYDGYPPELKPLPWIVRAIFRTMKRSFLTKPMKAGVKIPGIKGGTVGAQNVPFEQGLSMLRQGLDRLEKHAPTKPNAIFGPMTHQEWIDLQLRHAELHLSFLVIG